MIFTGLVAGLGLGALAEVTKRQLGLGKEGKKTCFTCLSSYVVVCWNIKGSSVFISQNGSPVKLYITVNYVAVKSFNVDTFWQDPVWQNLLEVHSCQKQMPRE